MRQMIACHKSQADWLEKHDGVDYVELGMRLSSFRGLQCGVEYAEAFRQHRVWRTVNHATILP